MYHAYKNDYVEPLPKNIDRDSVMPLGLELPEYNKSGMRMLPLAMAQTRCRVPLCCVDIAAR